MRQTSRSITLVLVICSVIAVCYVLAYGSVTAQAPIQSNSNVAIVLKNETPTSEPTATELIRFGPVNGLDGIINTTTLTLRARPDASAPVVATLKTQENFSVSILDATRDFIRIRINTPTVSKDRVEEITEHEGWAAWGAVIPSMAAIVLDAGTGAVVSRVPLGGWDTSVAYSPDGSRAIFYRTENYGDSILGYEVTTTDYALAHTVLSSEASLIRPIFYSPVDGALSAFGIAQVGGRGHLSLMRLSEFYTFDVPTKIAAPVSAFTVSPDGRTGFVFHPQDNERPEMTVDVVDLQSLEIRNTLSLGTEQSATPERVVVSRDGSEIYIERPETNSVAVINTMTGEQSRAFSKKFANSGWLYYTQGSLIGGSLLVKYSDEGGDEMHDRPRAAWLSETGHVAADPEIESVIEAGGEGFGVNFDGTSLFRLDAEHHIKERLPIERPEIRRRKEARNELTTQGIGASPDGKHIIVFVGLNQDGC